MTSNTPTPEASYVVFLPDRPTATPYRFRLPEEADVQDLEGQLRDHRDFKRTLENERITLFKCGTLASKSRDRADPAGKRYKKAIKWLRKEDNIKNNLMDPLDPLKEHFPSGPASFADKKIDVIVVTDSIMEYDLGVPVRERKRPRLDNSSESQEPQVDTVPLDIGNEDNRMMKTWKKYWGNALSAQFLGSPVSASVSHIEVEDGDLLPQSPFLKFPWNNERFLVRAEYIRIYNFVEDSFAENATVSKVKPPAVVITGQPGIGKTVWIYYALRRRLGEKRPTMLRLRGGYYLFTESGVMKVPDKSTFFVNYDYEKEPLWCLIDSSNANNGIPEELSGDGPSGINPVYVSSPTVDRWKKLHQSRSRFLAIMNPWTREEIDVAARTLLTGDRALLALELFEKFGPIARICLEYRNKEISDYESSCQSVIDRTDRMADELWSIAGNGTDLRMDAPQGIVASTQLALSQVSHKICRIQRSDVDTVSSEHYVLIMSKDIANRCAARLRQLGDDEVLRLWSLFSKFPDARGMTGSIFEAYVHSNFRSQIIIDGLEMFQLDGPYHASFASYDDRLRLKAAREARTDLQEFQINFRPRCTVVFLDGHITIQSDTYYQPESNNQVGIDALFMYCGYLYLVQMTGGYTHSIKASLKDFLGKMKGIPSEDKWRFVFVIPKNLERFECPKPVIAVGTVFTGKIALSPENESDI